MCRVSIDILHEIESLEVCRAFVVAGICLTYEFRLSIRKQAEGSFLIIKGQSLSNTHTSW